MTKKLMAFKTCPFCGSQADITQDDDSGYAMWWFGCESPICIAYHIANSEELDDLQEDFDLWNAPRT
jgi:hypothetical protein